jgi:cobalt-zinc-cadmium efflux system outer membrane protein
MRYSINPAAPLLLLLSFLVAGKAAAQDAGSQTVSLTLQQAISKALANNPGIEAARIDADIERSRRDALALGTPYRFDGMIENVGGTGDTSGFDASETTVLLTKTVEAGDKRERRRRLGDTRLDRAEIEIAMREASVAAETSRRYVRVLQLQESGELLGETTAIAHRTLDVVRKRVSIGRASEAEESFAAVTLKRAELDASRVGFEIVAARAALSTLWGATSPGFLGVRGDLYSARDVPAYESLRARLPDSPAMRRIIADTAIRHAEQQVALSRQNTDVEFSAGLRHLAVTDDVAMVVGVSVPFGSKRRAEPLVSASDAGIARTSANRERQALELESMLRTHYQSLLAASNELEVLKSEVIPEAERAVASYERGFELGRYALLELTAAQARLVDVRRDAVNAAASVQLALIEIESLLGNTNPGGALL